MQDPLHNETDFGWTPTGAYLSTPEAEQIARDRQEGGAARWYHAALPSERKRHAMQFGEPDPAQPRQVGELECGADGWTAA